MRKKEPEMTLREHLRIVREIVKASGQKGKR